MNAAMSIFKTVVMSFLTWLPLPFQMLIVVVFSAFALYVKLKLLKLIWDALPIA